MYIKMENIKGIYNNCEVIEILKKLVSYNTIKDKENNEILNFISSQLQDLGFKVEKKEKYLIMSIGKYYELGFIGHSDTVDYIEGWSTNPFKLIEKDGKLYGLGACDMKSGIAAFMQALKEVDLSKLKKGIKVYITYDEEISFKGIKEVLQVEPQMPDYIIVGEPTDNKILTGCKGLLAIKLNTTGIKVHSSRTDKGKNANSSMIKLLYELEEYYEKEIKTYQDKRYEVPYTTMNVGIIKGGNSINSVSDKCESYIDFRVIKEDHIQKIKDKVKELSEKYQATYKIDIEINPFFNNIDFIKEQNTASFMTEASFVKGKRIILGAGEVSAHEVDEHISIKSLQELVNQYKGLIYKICYN